MCLEHLKSPRPSLSIPGCPSLLLALRDNTDALVRLSEEIDQIGGAQVGANDSCSDKAWALHVGEMRHFLCVNRQLHSRHHPVTRPSAMPEAPLSVDRVDLD